MTSQTPEPLRLCQHLVLDASVCPHDECKTEHRPECWCHGTGWRTELGANVRCNLPQLADPERESAENLPLAERSSDDA